VACSQWAADGFSPKATACTPYSGKRTITGFSRFRALASIRLTMKSATSARATMPLRHAPGCVRMLYLPFVELPTSPQKSARSYAASQRLEYTEAD
jgi:hypothetical protein